MAIINRGSVPNVFANTSGSDQLSSLDANFTAQSNQINDSSLIGPNGICADTGTANNYSVVLPVGVPSGLNPGMMVSFIPANSNNGGSTLTVSPLGSAPILTPAGNPLQGGEIQVNKTVTLIYNNVSPAGFRFVSPCHLFKALNTGNVSVECAGYDSVTITNQMTTSSAISLLHIGLGIPIIVTFFNPTGSTQFFAIAATDPTGASVSVFANGPGGINYPLSTVTQTIANTFVYTFVGSYISSNQLNLIWGGK